MSRFYNKIKKLQENKERGSQNIWNNEYINDPYNTTPLLNERNHFNYSPPHNDLSYREREWNNELNRGEYTNAINKTETKEIGSS